MEDSWRSLMPSPKSDWILSAGGVPSWPPILSSAPCLLLPFGQSWSALPLNCGLSLFIWFFLYFFICFKLCLNLVFLVRHGLFLSSRLLCLKNSSPSGCEIPRSPGPTSSVVFAFCLHLFLSSTSFNRGQHDELKYGVVGHSESALSWIFELHTHRPHFPVTHFTKIVHACEFVTLTSCCLVLSEHNFPSITIFQLTTLLSPSVTELILSFFDCLRSFSWLSFPLELNRGQTSHGSSHLQISRGQWMQIWTGTSSKGSAVDNVGSLLEQCANLFMKIASHFQASLLCFLKTPIIFSACLLKCWPPVGTRCHSMPFFLPRSSLQALEFP